MLRRKTKEEVNGGKKPSVEEKEGGGEEGKEKKEIKCDGSRGRRI